MGVVGLARFAVTKPGMTYCFLMHWHRLRDKKGARCTSCGRYWP